MRTLKKTLCLVLVLAMMVGLCAMGASAVTIDDYKDKDQIPNPEAFATLTAIGVFQGDDQGNIRPNDALNRAEGATLATKMHSTSGSGISSFADMGAYAWAQPAVAFCEANGIINGVGGGLFAPGDPLTTVAFAKICITSLGYDAAREGLIGPQWEINTIKLVNALNLADGIGNPDWNAPIPRWQAAQFCYNTLQATMVDYSGGINMSVTTSDGTRIEVGEGASAVINNSYDYRNYLRSDKDNTMQFCEQYFPLLKMDTQGDTDAFGFESNAWYMGDTRVDRNRTVPKTIATVNASTIMATYDTGIAGVTTKTLYTDGKSDGKYTATLDNYVDHIHLRVLVNGYELADDVTMERLGTARPLSKYTGATAYLIDTDDMDQDGYGIADTLIIKEPLLAKVTKITEATASADRTATLTVYDKPTGTANVKFTTNSYAKNDFVLVYPNYNRADAEAFTTDAGLIYGVSELATSAAGTLTKLTNAAPAPGAGKYSAMTIGGVNYSIGSKAFLGPHDLSVANGDYVLGTGMTAYLSNGFVLGIVSDAVAYGDYVFSIAAVSNGTSALGNTSYTVGSVDQSGTASEVLGANIKATGDGTNGIWAYRLMTDTWATKVEAATGGFNFAPARDVNKEFTINGLKSNTPRLDNNLGGTAIIADNSTVFIIRTATGFKSYTGLKNVPNYAPKSGTGTDVDPNKGLETIAYALVPTYPGAHAAAVYIDATGATAKNTTTAKIYLVSGAAAGQEQVSGRNYYNYTAIVDGAITPILATKASFNNYGVVIPAYSGAYLDDTEDGGATPNNAAISENGDYVINADNGLLTFYAKNSFSANVLPLDENAVAYVYTSDRAPLETGKPAEVLNGLYDESARTDVTISVVKNPQTGLVTTIYVNMSAPQLDN